MKIELLIIILSLLIVSKIDAQLINAGFENWTNGKPDGWIVSSHNMSVSRTIDCYLGTYAVRFRNVHKIGSNGGAQLINGTTENGIPVSQRYTNLSGWYKYTHAIYEELKIEAIFKKNGAVIGEGLIDTLSETSSYKNFICQINYYSNEIPDTVVIILSFIDYNNTGVPSDASAYFDEITLDLPSDTRETAKGQLTQGFILSQNYPNPFNPTTKISWQSSVGSWQTLKVYDVLGNVIAILVDEFRQAGKYEVEFEAGNHSSGIYLYKLSVGEYVEIMKMMLLR